MKLHRLTTDLWVPSPLEEVFAFFADARNLDAITPPWLHFRIATPGPIEMRPRAEIDYRLRVRGIPMRWRSAITAWDPPHRFVDVQLRGPYLSWHHEHRFAEADGGTMISDVVDYAAPGWILEPLIHRLLVQPDVRRIFTYRQEKLAERYGLPRSGSHAQRGIELSPGVHPA